MQLPLLYPLVFLVKNDDKGQPVVTCSTCMYVCQALHADRQLHLSLDKSSEPSGCHKLHHRGDAYLCACKLQLRCGSD